MTPPLNATLLALGQPDLADDTAAARGIVIGLMLSGLAWMVIVGLACWWLA